MTFTRPDGRACSGSSREGASAPGRHSRSRIPDPRAVRRRERGGAAAVFLTFSLLLLVMALGFVFGRVVIARAYIKGVGALVKPPEAVAPRDQASAPASTVFVPSRRSRAVIPAPPVEAAPETVDEIPVEEPLPEEEVLAEVVLEEEAPPPEARERPPVQREEGGDDVRYAIQVGLFSSEGGARDTLGQLTRSGHPSRIEVDRQRAHTMYRVLSGSYRNEANARKALDEIRGEGFAEAFVVAR